MVGRSVNIKAIHFKDQAQLLEREFWIRSFFMNLLFKNHFCTKMDVPLNIVECYLYITFSCKKTTRYM